MNIKYDYGVIYIDNKIKSNAELADILIKQQKEIEKLNLIVSDLDNGKVKRTYGGIFELYP